MRGASGAVLTVAALVAVAAAGLHGQPASACGVCASDLSSPAPAFRREALPANAAILLSGRGLDAGSITVSGSSDAGSVAVPFTVEEGHDTQGSVFVKVRWPGPGSGQVTLRSNLGASIFDIEARQDRVAPAAPDVTSWSEGRADACCENTAVSLAVSGGADDDGTLAGVLKVQVSAPSSQRVVLLGYRPGGWYALGTSQGGCLATDPLAVDGEAIEVTTSVLDWAGNESPSRGPVHLTYRRMAPGGCPGPTGCSIPAHGGGPLAWLALLALGGRRSTLRAN